MSIYMALRLNTKKPESVAFGQTEARDIHIRHAHMHVVHFNEIHIYLKSIIGDQRKRVLYIMYCIYMLLFQPVFFVCNLSRRVPMY